MKKIQILIAAALPAVVVYFIDSPILKYPIAVWKEPVEIILHILVTLILSMVLVGRLGPLSGLVGGLLFSVCPVHAYSLAVGGQDWRGVILYGLVLGVAVVLSVGFERFYRFLKTQEDVVRYLFLTGVGVLILAMVLISVSTNAIWKDEVTLWQWRSVHHPLPKAFNELARLRYQRHGQADEAIGLYKKALALDVANQDALFALGSIYLDQARTEDVISTFNQLVKIYPEDNDILMRIIKGYSDAIARYPQEAIYQEKREDALASYEQVSKRKKYSANDYFNLGFLYDQVGGYEEAMRFYRKALELQPNHDKSLFALARRYQEVSDFKSAMALYERLVHFHPRTTLAYLNMGIICNALGAANKAKYFYQKVISIDANNADAYFNLGYLNETSGDLKEALNLYEKAIENNPQLAEAYYNMGNVYATLEQYPEAIASYLKTVAINPKHQNAYVNLSILSFKAKDFQGSIRYLEEAKLLGYVPPAAFLKTLEPYRKR